MLITIKRLFYFSLSVIVSCFIVSLLFVNEAIAVTISESVTTSSPNPSSITAYSDRGEVILDSKLIDGTPAEDFPANFRIHVYKINGSDCDFWFKAHCYGSAEAACRSVNHGKPGFKLTFRLVSGNLYDCTVPSNYWGACSKDRAAPRAQNMWDSLKEDGVTPAIGDKSKFQPCRITANYEQNLGTGDSPDIDEELFYGESKYLTNAKQTNPNKSIVENDPLYPNEESYIKSKNDRRGEYYAKTPPTGPISTNHINDVSATWQTIIKEGSRYKIKGSWTNWNYTYKVSTPITWSETIVYKATIPPVTQTKYTPFNLNYNTFAKPSDVTGKLADTNFYNKTKLDMSIDNLRKIKDGSLLQALDINNDFDYKVKFNNNVFGLPTSFNWYNTPPALVNGQYENSNHSLPYANGHSGQGDGYYRYNTTFSAKMNDANKNVTSLVFNNTEYLNNNPIKVKNDTPNKFLGGNFISRFILVGNYTTGNGLNTSSYNSKFPEWWSILYTQSKAYEYGTEYKGYIDSHYIYKPNLLNGCQTSTSFPFGQKFSNTGQTITITTNGTSDRALYVTYRNENFEQPVLFAKWNVKTLAGDIN